MLLRVNIENAGIFDDQESLEEELQRLSNPGYMEARLSAIDKVKPINRIFVMGCGRSGTWLLAAVMTTLKDVDLIYKELHMEYFGLFSTSCSTLVLKRNYKSYETIENIPTKIGIVYIVRHPYDVLTSHNPALENRYHVKLYNWLGEMQALQYLIDTGRSNTKIIRYEDLVLNPEKIQSELASFFGLEVERTVDDLTETFKPNAATEEAMHGLRKIDKNSINKFRNDPKNIQYLHRIRPRLGRMLEWVAQEFDYDIALPGKPGMQKNN